MIHGETKLTSNLQFDFVCVCVCERERERERERDYLVYSHVKDWMTNIDIPLCGRGTYKKLKSKVVMRN